MKYIVQHLPDRPPLVPDEYRPGDTVWMVIVIPSWLRRLFGAKECTFIIETRPLRKDLMHPTSRRPPDHLLRAIEREQSMDYEPRLQLTGART